MGEYLRVGKVMISGSLVRASAEPGGRSNPGFSRLMSHLAPISVQYNPGRDIFTYYAYSPLFDDVLLCEGEDPPEYSIIIEANAAGDFLVSAKRQAGEGK